MYYRADDNTGDIKINFISDNNIAAEMNERGRTTGTSVVGSPVLMGGYTFPILADLSGGNEYQILKAPLPSDGSDLEAKIKQLLQSPETVYAYVDAGDVTIVQIEGWNRFHHMLSERGWSINNKAKTFKRLKTLNRPFRLWSSSDEPLRVAIVEDTDYTDEDMSSYTEEEQERLLDGAFVISRSLFNDCLANVSFPEFVNDPDHPELAVDMYRAQEFLNQAQFFHAFNARIFGPMHFVGVSEDDPLWSKPGMLKGECFIHVSDTLEKMKVDVVAARSAIKFEVGNSQTRFVLLEPQTAKRSGVNSDLQSMTNLPAIYQFHDVSQWTRNYLLANLEALKNDKVMEGWFDMSTPFFNSSNRFDQNDVLTLTKWNARAWLMSGLRITSSPWLFEQLGSAIAKTLRARDNSKLRFPVPCAARAQVISQSFASMCGVDTTCLQGQARWVNELEAVVVNDHDWLEMYRSHGGMDLDDFFVIYWRTIDNMRKLVCVRSPNDIGEYSVFDYVDPDWFPVFEGIDGNMIFPEVSGAPEFWVKRLSQAYADGEILYTGLPSEKNPAVVDEHPYTMRDVVALMSNNRASASCVGANVNARVFWSLSMRKHRPQQLAPMEACIDTGTQGGSAEDAEAVHAEAKDIIEQVLRDPAAPIDAYLWETRFRGIYGDPFDRSRLTGATHISLANRFRKEAAGSFMNQVREHAQTLVPNINPQIHRLGKLWLRPAYEMLLATRGAMVGMQAPGDQTLIPGDWRDVHSMVLAKLQEFTDPVDAHDYVLGLYSVCFRIKTASSQKYSDQLVMNPHVFPFTLAAMRYYGLAYHIDVTDEGKLARRLTNEWDIKCVGCGNEQHTTDPLAWQHFHHFQGVCRTCRATVSAG